MDLFEQVSEDIKNAMKAKDKSRLGDIEKCKEIFLGSENRSGSQ